ncbi:SirB2 family protein [Motilimonas eburnea]|uniref:SirB2 family protein n=1 Tax=Motilimonas eburnea TaxID=1737488 RepID=UPI001E54F6F8|nr:SirB2 family protein [Motilimonas eburnea]MCE2572231.1 SirB2 family protein [Motilimonas eburnea]
MDYLFIKQSHQLLVALSLMLFWWRVVLRLMQHPWCRVKWLKILPHCNDTGIVLIGAWLCYALSIWPWQLDWLMVKLTALLIYIALGSVSLKFSRTNQGVLGFAIAATGIYCYMIGVAMAKSGLSWWGLYGS